MAINNLAEQCYLPAYGPLENMNILTMMDMVKVISYKYSYFILVPWPNLNNQEFDFRSTFWTRQTQRRERGDWWSRGPQWQAEQLWQTEERGDRWKASAVKRKSKAQVKSVERVRWRVDAELLQLIMVSLLTEAAVCWAWMFIFNLGNFDF